MIWTYRFNLITFPRHGCNRFEYAVFKQHEGVGYRSYLGVDIEEQVVDIDVFGEQDGILHVFDRAGVEESDHLFAEDLHIDSFLHQEGDISGDRIEITVHHVRYHSGEEFVSDQLEILPEILDPKASADGILLEERNRVPQSPL